MQLSAWHEKSVVFLLSISFHLLAGCAPSFAEELAPGPTPYSTYSPPPEALPQPESESTVCHLTPLPPSGKTSEISGCEQEQAQARALPVREQDLTLIRDGSKAVLKVLERHPEKFPEFPKEVLDAKIPKAVIDQIYRQWIGKPEGWLKRALMYLPRLARYTYEFGVKGRTAKRMVNIFKSGVEFLKFGSKDHLDRSGHLLSDSILNPLGTAGDVISDSVNLLQVPYYATKRLSTRVQVCTQNLMEVTEIGPPAVRAMSPAVHVAAVIDKAVSTSDPNGGDSIIHNLRKRRGAICTPATLPSDMTESAYIYRLLCANSVYSSNAKYQFFGYNCGGYTRDILNWTGSDMTTVPNFGLGAQLQLPFAKHQKSRRDSKSSVVNSCNDRLTFFLQTALIMESGKTLSEAHSRELAEPMRLWGFADQDIALQLIISAARGKNAKNFQFITDKLTYFFSGGVVGSFSNYLISGWDFKTGNIKDTPEKPLRIRPEVKDMLRGMMVGLDPESKEWLSKKFPVLKIILNQLDREAK